MRVSVERCADYDQESIGRALSRFDGLFGATIRPGDQVVLKPNWLAASHKYKRDEWRCVITAPEVITGVLARVLRHLDGRGRVTITDGPQTDSSWTGIMTRMTPDVWTEMGRQAGVPVAVLDLREHEWTTRGDVNIRRRTLAGDPLGSTAVDLGTASEFVGHRRSQRGYYGADYDVAETNAAHDGTHNRYKVSRTVMSADVFINLPKMKTHKKAGITCALKNLVGINTYKNWLPHHTEGTPTEGGDQFPVDSTSSRMEGVLTDRFKAVLTRAPGLGRFLVPIKAFGKRVFGDTQHTIRSGNWYGNDTLWRMVLDLNKALLYGNPDGSLRPDTPSSRRRYLAIVDGVVAGEGNGPEAPDAKAAGVLVAGTAAVAVDAVCARLMGLDWRAIPCVRNAFSVAKYPLCDSGYDDIVIASSDELLAGPISELPLAATDGFRPHFGWRGHVEMDRAAL
jgi:uncharacterized protein (DUF362 family)